MPFLSEKHTVTTTLDTTPSPILTFNDVFGSFILAIQNSGAVTCNFTVQWSVNGIDYVDANILEVSEIASGAHALTTIDKKRPQYIKVRGNATSGTCGVTVTVWIFDPKLSAL